MPELGALREAEEYAEKVIDQSRKDAQKSRLGIPARIEAMNREKEARLQTVAAQAEAAVETEMRDLRVRLETETATGMERLDTRRETVEDAALRLLRERILGGGAAD